MNERDMMIDLTLYKIRCWSILIGSWIAVEVIANLIAKAIIARALAENLMAAYYGYDFLISRTNPTAIYLVLNAIIIIAYGTWAGFTIAEIKKRRKLRLEEARRKRERKRMADWNDPDGLSWDF